MKVLKFRGTSVGSPSSMKEVAKLVHNGEQGYVFDLKINTRLNWK